VSELFGLFELFEQPAITTRARVVSVFIAGARGRFFFMGSPQCRFSKQTVLMMAGRPLWYTVACPNCSFRRTPLGGEALVSLGRVERTESINDTAKFCKAICAFANDMPGHRLPGYLCIGVDKDGSPTSAAIDERLLETLAGQPMGQSVATLPRSKIAISNSRI
jgi:hypothetical protein